VTLLSNISIGDFSFLKTIFRRNVLGITNGDDEMLLRAELFSTSQMEQHGRTLAALHAVGEDRVPERLLTRLATNEAVLLKVRDLVTEAVRAGRRVTPAGEWLLDNFYLIGEQVQTAKRLLPKGYAKGLPRLKDGPSKGLPRVYDIALETISHGDGRIDPEGLRSFVAAYQTVATLQLGELWAIPIMLRLALIENLRRVAVRIAADRLHRNLADYWADKITDAAEKDPKNLILTVADMARSKPPMVSSFVAELTRRLQGHGAPLALPLTWTEQQLAGSYQTIAQLVQAENQQQAADQLSISNSIGSLRFLGAIDWREFVEQMSAVEETLSGDPSGLYGRMAFGTRDRYRHVVEEIAKKSGLEEKEVARLAIALAEQAGDGTSRDSREKHVGFYLIDRGLPGLENRAGVRPSVADTVRKTASRFPLPLYAGTILLFALIFATAILAGNPAHGIRGPLLWIIGVLSLLSVSSLAIALVNLFTARLVTPRPLPRMDFSKGIPSEWSTFVVVPTMLTNPVHIGHLVEALEIRFLANRDDNLRFGLLTDFRDATGEKQPMDETLLSAARQGIEELNEKYRGSTGDYFFLFHRPRQWNRQEQTWMGYERKRGKLAALNALLRGGADTGFSLVVGNIQDLPKVKYIITLDTDTELPRDSARQLVGAMAHPLNLPQYDAGKGRIVAGYGILQPRVAISLPGTNRSRYARMWGSDAGVDPYTRVVSDVYQDLFGEGSFIGKGIYDIDAFEQVLSERFPENRILSHDLIEGCYARSGLISDVQLYEEYPSRYSADVNRRRRWIRGDWQLLRWLLPGVPTSNSRFGKNPLTSLSRWKIFDNLRRSLVSPALTLLGLLGWTVLPSPWFWTGSIFAIVLIPSLTTSIMDLFRKPEDVLTHQHVADLVRSAGRAVTQAIFTLLCLPHEAFFSGRAILHTLWRMVVSGKGLLEWNPSGEADRGSRTDLAASWRTMLIAPIVALVTTGYLLYYRPFALPGAAPILALWLVSPFVTWWISKPLGRQKARLSEDQILFLRKVSRKTWAFFETFVGPVDHWLPPDNYQEEPVAVIAHRTSPTNMGLALLSNLSASDFCYISVGQFMERTASGLDTMAALERHRGHFYNWYDTQSLKPLLPMYVSSVDSGNLAASLLTLRAGLIALPDAKLLGQLLFRGLADTLMLLSEAAGKERPSALARMEKEIGPEANSLSDSTLAVVKHKLERLTASAAELVHSAGPVLNDDALSWVAVFAAQCETALNELGLYAPWAHLLPTQDSTFKELPLFDDIPTLRQIAYVDREQLHQVRDQAVSRVTAEELQELDAFIELVIESSARAKDRIEALEALASRCGELASAMEWEFLYDRARHLLTIGYNVSEGRSDSSYYDLLASEARLSSFVAIAQGQLPQESWFALGRLLTAADGEPVLLSWSGSMFEYLMPLIVMPTYENTLLDQTCKAAVARQIDYGRRRGVPWGISESSYNMFDGHLNYQYSAFGVPGLGLKRGLAGDLVIAPYASALALMVAPEEAARNLETLSTHGLEGKYGFYDAVDYTPTHLPRGHSNVVVRSFMAHHQGMSLLSLAYLLLDRPMQKRFESDPAFQATMLLLQERLPKASAYYSHTPEPSEMHSDSHLAEEKPVRVYSIPDTLVPEVHLLSNGRYHVMITNAGGGYSRWKDMAVTRWEEDTTRDNWGSFCYIRDVASGVYWSTAYQPTCKTPKEYEAIFSEGRAEFRRRDEDIDTHTEIAVSPEDDAELRRITITNRSAVARTIDITTYAEVVLAPPAADALHPAFSKLFVQTEIIREQRAIVATRRPRSVGEEPPWMFHVISVQGAEADDLSYETDRRSFIGRGNTGATPAAMNTPFLSGSVGPVLDPIVAIRCRMTLEPATSATVNVVTGVGESREKCTRLVGKYQDRHLADRVFELAWTHEQVLLRQINATEPDVQLFGRLAASVLYANSGLRAGAGLLLKNLRGQSGLWGYSVSGDLPIVLLRIEDRANIELVRQLIQAHSYWRLKGLPVDLVIWNEDHAGYRQALHDEIMGLIAAGADADLRDRPGGIFVRPVDQVAEEDRILFQAVARAIISDGRGTLTEQLDRRGPVEPIVAPLVPTRTHRPLSQTVAPIPREDLSFFNGLGGFTPDGREYVVSTGRNQVTPAPWINVLANPSFGSLVSESGIVYTWSENAHEFRLTPWHNDPVSDCGGEAFYLRDEERGHFWSPMPLPARGATPYVTRHGFGYTVFEHEERGVSSETWVYVAMDAPVKFTVLKVRNHSGRPRRLSVTGYADWVLGDIRPKSAMHIVTEIDPQTGALLARNPYSAEFSNRVAFFNVDHATRTVSGDRTEFLGRNGTLAAPAAMARSRLSGRVGPGLDPCGALQVAFDLDDGEERDIFFTLGSGKNGDDAAALALRHRDSVAARQALVGVWSYWNHTLGAVQIETPDQSINLLGNGWLLYQTIACRLWGRSGYYQSGGAFGFRDQLQDSMALVHTEPRLLREHLLLCASHQFPEGDVQHWWHPPFGRGVRTLCSDDFLWLPLATCRYVKKTGDTGVLDELIPFVKGRPVNPEEDSYYDLPSPSTETAGLFDHCVRAIKKGLRFGEHGLPLIGSGDWNDGMNMVGPEGKGESIWLAFFLYDVLRRFSPLARHRGDTGFAQSCESEAERLRENIERNGWDGQWYRRAYFDDGTPLGSAANPECRIDSIAQSWSVLSGGGDGGRSRMAMDAVDRLLVRRGDALVQLLDPPFDKSDLNPGYIKGYVPGVRENGGQYTHAAIWAAMAFAKLGDARRAWEFLTMINPVNHGRSPGGIAKYKVEPYVVAADVYGVAPHTGMGGWTWYTGSAAWMYRLIMESLLGLKLEVDKLSFEPCIPAEWDTFTVHYRFRETVYHVKVRQKQKGVGKVAVITVDGVVQEGEEVCLVDDQEEHFVEVVK
jgi:cyclic beta-1,2-glucan synthetase